MKRVQERVQSKSPIKWIFAGDSITQGAFHTAGWRDYTEIFCERIRYELRRADDIVIKAAYDGNTTRHLLEAFDWRIGQFQPDVVFVMVGVNDCAMENSGPRVALKEFRENLLLVAKKIQKLKAIPVFQTSGLILSKESPERAPYLGAYMDEVRNISASIEAPLIDHSTNWEKLCRRQPARFQYWLSDALHPNEMGHRVFAHWIFRSLGIFDAKSPVCRASYL